MFDKEDNMMSYVYLFPNRSYIFMDPLTRDACFHLILAKTSAPSRDTTCASKHPKPSFAMRVHHTYLWIE